MLEPPECYVMTRVDAGDRGWVMVEFDTPSHRELVLKQAEFLRQPADVIHCDE